MNTSSPTSRDLFISRKGILPRGKKLVRSANHEPTLSARQTKQERLRLEQLREERGRLIRLTIAHRSLETHFQPIIDLKTGAAVGTEALSRFAPEPIRPPDIWFAEAADLGLGVELEQIALDSALEQLNHLPTGMYLSLNASVETIMSEQFRAMLADAPAERIVLELTEHTPVTDYSAFAASVDQLRSRGVRLAVDDAGSGFSSFSHILNLRPDIIKLDIALTRGIDKDPARQALGRALLNFGLETFRTTIVAEGIETKGELETLRSLGCPSGQGFILGRPSRAMNRRQAFPLQLPRPVPELELVLESLSR